MQRTHGGTFACLKGVTQVFHALRPIERGLSPGMTRAPESPQNGCSSLLGKNLAKELCLVVAAFAAAPMEKRHRDERIGFLTRNPLILQGFRQPFRELTPQVFVAIVLEAKNKFSNDAARLAGCDGAIKVQITVCAIWAGKLAVDVAFKGLGASLATRRDDSPCTASAIVAKPAVTQIHAAGNASAREE